ncbi:MAG: 6-pyruvoyl-tetrahydropterin synthase-related protein [Candidatus Levybacteria bacterium]|nr:6-pyruvoyl-tetrahydropterin synthase-related protein [Candidatus Levybacteria bacterium]
MRYIRYYFLIVILSIIPFAGIFFTFLLPHTHDGFVHLARIGAYFKALGDGQIPVRWAGDLNYGYGMPLFNFMYQVPYLIASFFVLLGIGLVSAFKATLILSFVLSGIFMLGFSLAFFKDVRKAVLVTILYQFMPFRLVEILVRGSFGEVYAYAFFPLVLWGITLIFQNKNYKNILITALGAAFLILSHNALSLVFFATSMLFILFFAGKPRNYIAPFAALFLGLLLAAFYWVPAIFEHRYTYGDLFMKDLYLSHFPPIQNFFIPNFFNNSSLQTGGISVQFGLFHTLIFIVAAIILFSKRITKFDKKLFIFCFLIFAAGLFIMQPISKPIWEKVSLLRQFQFSWRMLSVVGFSLSLMSVSIFYFRLFKNNLIYLLLLFLVVFSTLY